MGNYGPKILIRSEVAKLLTSEMGISAREAERFLKAWNIIAERIILAGYSLTLGKSLRIAMRPRPSRKRFSFLTKRAEDEPGYWEAILEVSRNMRREIRKQLGEPTSLELKEFADAGKRKR